VKTVAFDLLGSSFALLQLLMDLVYLGKRDQVTGGHIGFQYLNHLNMIKLFMSTFSIAFDFVFLVQHWFMFRDAVLADKRRELFEYQRNQRQEVTSLIDRKLKDMPAICTESNMEGSCSQRYYQGGGSPPPLELELSQDEHLPEHAKSIRPLSTSHKR
jgi:hypothetical protein